MTTNYTCRIIFNSGRIYSRIANISSRHFEMHQPINICMLSVKFGVFRFHLCVYVCFAKVKTRGQPIERSSNLENKAK